MVWKNRRMKQILKTELGLNRHTFLWQVGPKPRYGFLNQGMDSFVGLAHQFFLLLIGTMKWIETLFKSKWFVGLLVAIPALRVAYAIFTEQLGGNPVEFLLIESGESAAILLIVTLWLSPLRLRFPKVSLFKICARHSRLLGVSSFVYACAHLLIYVFLENSDLEELLENFLRYFIVTGLGAFLILWALAMTSTNWAIKKMGAKRWKKLHRTVYIAAFLVILHMVAKEKSDILKTLIFFGPLIIAEADRFWRYRKNLALKKQR